MYDNEPDGKGHRLVARFIAGELVKMTHSLPDWLKRFVGRRIAQSASRRIRRVIPTCVMDGDLTLATNIVAAGIQS